MLSSQKGIVRNGVRKDQGCDVDVRKNNKDLTFDERKKLNRLFEYSPELKLAYTFREELTAIFELRLTKWRDRVRRKALTCFDKVSVQGGSPANSNEFLMTF